MPWALSTYSFSSSGLSQSLRFFLLISMSGPEMRMGLCAAAIMNGVGSELMAAFETHLSPSCRQRFFTAPHACWNAHVSLLPGSSLQGPVHALLNALRKISCALLGRVFLIFSGRSLMLFQGIKGEWSIMVYNPSSSV